MASVAIVDSAASYRAGLAAALAAARHSPVAEGDLAEAVVVTVHMPDACHLLDTLVEEGKVVVALLPDPSPASHAHALSHGVAGTAAWEADPAEIVRIVTDAIAGWCRLPGPVATALASEWPGAHLPRPDVTSDEVSWLVDLAAGKTVSRLADDSGFSERAMFRRLHELYTRLGVNGRAEAILAAERLGLLDA